MDAARAMLQWQAAWAHPAGSTGKRAPTLRQVNREHVAFAKGALAQCVSLIRSGCMSVPSAPAPPTRTPLATAAASAGVGGGAHAVGAAPVPSMALVVPCLLRVVNPTAYPAHITIRSLSPASSTPAGAARGAAPVTHSRYPVSPPSAPVGDSPHASLVFVGRSASSLSPRASYGGVQARIAAFDEFAEDDDHDEDAARAVVEDGRGDGADSSHAPEAGAGPASGVSDDARAREGGDVDSGDDGDDEMGRHRPRPASSTSTGTSATRASGSTAATATMATACDSSGAAIVCSWRHTLDLRCELRIPVVTGGTGTRVSQRDSFTRVVLGMEAQLARDALLERAGESMARADELACTWRGTVDICIPS